MQLCFSTMFGGVLKLKKAMLNFYNKRKEQNNGFGARDALTYFLVGAIENTLTSTTINRTDTEIVDDLRQLVDDYRAIMDGE
jgi:hypothetical protein